MGLLRSRSFIGIACISLSLFICFGLAPLYSGVLSEKVVVTRIKTKVEKGELFSSSNLENIEVGRLNLPNNIVMDDEYIIGKYAKRDFVKGGYVFFEDLSDKPVVKYPYLYNFTGKERAISVTLKSFAAGLSGKLIPGDIISIQASNYGENQMVIAPSELQYIEVLAVTTSKGIDISEFDSVKEGYFEGEVALPSTITLKVLPVQAEILTDLEINGKIHIVFAFRGDKESSNLFLNKQHKYLEEISGITLPGDKKMGNELLVHRKEAIFE